MRPPSRRSAVTHNRPHGWLAAAQDEEQLMDMASQCGRWSTDGTAELRGNGMFVRRERLEAVGGWAPTALTEDLEMSTRLVLHGERVALAPEVGGGARRRSSRAGRACGGSACAGRRAACAA